MTVRTKSRNGRPQAPKPGLGLLAMVRHRARRRRTLAELRALDGGRLADIGLSQEARARIVG